MVSTRVISSFLSDLKREGIDWDGSSHTVYVVKLSEEARENKRFAKANPASDPSKPCVYVGLTGLTPEERFENHKAGHKASRWVRKHGMALVPPLYQPLGRMPYETAKQIEERLAKHLRSCGYAVWQN